MTEPAYRVLARKYRPQTFADLVGQEAMVRVLRGAFETGRIAQAFILTGVRGTGKTTTARIIAKGLNCEGPDGSRTTPTIEPCGACGPCRAIDEGRLIDVMEIDAASNTGVDFVREISEIARTAPTARYRVFILDEVHMLSTSAFNALLKTLEEPPPHVKFVFATTEIRKVPVTVLSRCQRFDLRRIEAEAMIALLRRIAEAEGAEVEDAAFALIARAAEGSARDATSLLDQAIGGGGRVEAEAVRAMLGLADRGRILDLFEAIMRGNAAGALAELGGQYAQGADPMAVLQGLAEAAHWLSVVKVAPGTADDPAIPPAERDRGRAMAEGLPMRALARAWQMLLKAIEEAREAPSAMMAAEMAVIRLTHVADLPSPEELVRRLGDVAPHETAARAPARGEGGAPAAARAEAVPAPAMAAPPARAPGAALAQPQAPQAASMGGAPLARAAPLPAHEPQEDPLARYQAFEDVVALVRERRDVKLLIEVETGLRLARYAPGRIEFAPAEGAPRDLAPRLKERLERWTGARWGVSVVSEGAPTIAERQAAEASSLEAQAMAHPLVQAVIAEFPGARIAAIRPRIAAPAAPEPGYIAEDEEPEGGWSPFEED